MNGINANYVNTVGCGNNCNCCGRNYGFFKFFGDVLMICLTFGWWVVWIFVREMRRNRC